MNSDDLEMRLQELIAQAIDRFPNASPVDLVRWTRENHGDIVEQFENQNKRKWADDRLVSRYLDEMRRRRPTKEPVRQPKLLTKGGRPRFGNPNQTRLPFNEEFERIPYYMILEPRTRTTRGKEIELPNATLADLKKRRSLIKGEQSMELPQLNRLIQIMQTYERMRPGITVKKALELRSTAKREDKQG